MRDPAVASFVSQKMPAHNPGSRRRDFAGGLPRDRAGDRAIGLQAAGYPLHRVRRLAGQLRRGGRSRRAQAEPPSYLRRVSGAYGNSPAAYAWNLRRRWLMIARRHRMPPVTRPVTSRGPAWRGSCGSRPRRSTGSPPGRSSPNSSGTSMRFSTYVPHHDARNSQHHGAAASPATHSSGGAGMPSAICGYLSSLTKFGQTCA